MLTKFNGTCDTCGRPMHNAGCSTGYGRDDLGRRHCFTCCGETDTAVMRDRGKATLYLVTEGAQSIARNHAPRHFSARITNWPGTLDIPCQVKTGRHNIAGKRYDAWFTGPDGRQWHGVQYGDNTQIIRCKRVNA